MFDLSVLPVAVEAGQPQKTLPGLWVGAAPRRAARLRAQDRLAFFFNQSGSGLLAPNLEQEMLSRLAESYFSANGSVTAAMRATAERLNEFLLNRNLRGARAGGAVTGGLAMAVLRPEPSSLYVLLAGDVHAYRITPTETEHYQDAGGRALGQARAMNQRFFTATLPESGLLLFSADAPAAWDETTLKSWAGADADALRPQLTGEALNRRAAALRWQPGRGEVNWVGGPQQIAPAQVSLPQPSQRPTPGQAQQPVKAERPRPALGGLFARKLPAKPEVTPPAHQEQAAPERPSAGQVARQEMIQPAAAPRAGAIPPARPQSVPAQTAPARPAATRVNLPGLEASSQPATSRPATQPHPSQPSASSVAAARAAAGAMGGFRRGLGKLGDMLSKLAARAIPGQPEEGLSISNGSMLFISLAVPLVVVAVAATVYFQQGRGEQFQSYLRAAQQFASQAAAQEDVTLRRENWNQALYWLDKAGPYGQSDESTALRQQAWAALDAMDGIQRLEFLPAGGTLPAGSQVIRMVATINDVYLLDSTSGSVYRLYRTGQGYELDSQFSCGPGRAGSAIIGPLIDIAALPLNNDFQATVLGLDAGGNLVYCAPGQSGFSSTMLTPPDMHWGEIQRMTMFQNVLYVLDPQVNMVYRYYGDSGVAFAGGPRMYFDAQIPQLNDIVDIAVDQEYLYLLHADGSMTTCTDSGYSATCSDPTPYGDNRQGRDPAPLRFEEAGFVRLQSTQPPDPSLYVLDQEARAIYQFSLRALNLQRQFRPAIDGEYPLPSGQATGFVVTSNRRVLMAIGNQVFYAGLP